MKKRMIFIGIGIFFWLLTGVWKSVIVQQWIQRIPPGWQWSSNFIGVSTYPDESMGRFPDKDSIGLYQRSIKVESESQRPNEVMLVDHFAISDIDTGLLQWEYEYRAAVNPLTGEHVQPQYRNQYFLFPRNVQKKNYILRFSYLKGIQVAYRNEDVIEGVRVYHFVYKGRGEYTESYQGNKDYAGVPVQPGQEIKCADDQFSFQVWVEPLTGEIVKIQESCYSGDYIFNIASGQAVKPVYRWAGINTSDNLIQQATHVRNERNFLLWVDLYLPLLTVLLGLLFFLWGGNPGRV